MTVIASIHKPTTATFNLFSQLALFFAGRPPYFTTQGMPIPPLINVAEFLLDVCTTDFDNSRTDLSGDESRIGKLNLLIEAWFP